MYAQPVPAIDEDTRVDGGTVGLGQAPSMSQSGTPAARSNIFPTDLTQWHASVGTLSPMAGKLASSSMRAYIAIITTSSYNIHSSAHRPSPASPGCRISRCRGTMTLTRQLVPSTLCWLLG